MEKNLKYNIYVCGGFPGGSVGKEPVCNAGVTGDAGLIPGLGRFPGGGRGNPLQYSCLEQPMDRGAWQASAHGAENSWTAEAIEHACMHACIYMYV